MSLGKKRKATKQQKEQREGEGEAGARVLWARLGLGSGWGHQEGWVGFRGPRVAPVLTPRSRLPFPPLPRLPAPSQCSSFSSPRALSSGARGSVLGIKRKEGGGKGGKGKGRRRKGDDPSKGGC